MKFEKGDAGVGMLVIMAVMMIGVWVASGHGWAGHHSNEPVVNEAISSVQPAGFSYKKDQGIIPYAGKSD